MIEDALALIKEYGLENEVRGLSVSFKDFLNSVVDFKTIEKRIAILLVCDNLYEHEIELRRKLGRLMNTLEKIEFYGGSADGMYEEVDSDVMEFPRVINKCKYMRLGKANNDGFQMFYCFDGPGAIEPELLINDEDQSDEG